MHKIDKKIAIAAVVLFAFIAVYEIFSIGIIWHELGHMLSCILLKAVPRVEVTDRQWKTICHKDIFTESEVFWISMAGVMAEAVLALALLLNPASSAMGGYIFFSTSICNFYGCYAHDFEQAGMEMLLTPFFKIYFLVLTFLIFVVSCWWYLGFWEKQKFKF